MRKLAWMACALALLACASKQKTQEAAPAPEPQPAAVEATPPVPPPVPAVAETPAPPPRRCGSDAACESNEICTGSGVCAPATLDALECRPVVHFDYDRSVLRDADLPALERLARCLRADPQAKVTFEGHCDERGTTEYNLHLGDRRARAAATYVHGFGIASERLFTVSYGKEKPLCLEHDEACWARNRRAVPVPGEPTEQVPAQAMR
ncbi:MAG TPA: OmpA family protein [Anaeromyxobacteraceae bacterium]|nr:OmpA family protein [Anaeromyxobacteraceae bacterium]